MGPNRPCFLGPSTVALDVYPTSWPFNPEEQRDLAATLQLQITPGEYPFLAEMMNWIMQARVPQTAQKDHAAYESEFEFGLDLILDGLERLRRK